MSNVLKITGKTFEHRETLKRLGGKFDGVTKAWTVPATPANRHDIQSLPGVIINETVEEYKPPLTPNQSRFQRQFGKPAPSLSAKRDEPLPEPKVRMPQAVIGDTEEHITTFGPATNFAGFSSLAAMIDFIEKIPTEIRDDPRRDNAWHIYDKRTEFTGTVSMAAAIKLTRDGWAEGVEMAKKIAERIVGQQPVKRQRVHAVAGGSVNVGRMLSGNPLHMRQRAKLPASKIVTLVHNFNNSHTVAAKDMEIRAAVVAAIADTLEDNGYSCEILAAANNIYGIAKGYESDSSRHAIDVVKLKSAGERLNLSDVMFGLGHPSFLRRFAFARWACIEPFPYKNMGYTGKLKFETPNTFVIGNLPHKFKTDGLSLDAKIEKIVAHVVPENLPLEFKFHA